MLLLGCRADSEILLYVGMHYLLLLQTASQLLAGNQFFFSESVTLCNFIENALNVPHFPSVEHFEWVEIQKIWTNIAYF